MNDVDLTKFSIKYGIIYKQNFSHFFIFRTDNDFQRNNFLFFFSEFHLQIYV